MAKQRCFALLQADDAEPTPCQFTGKISSKRASVVIGSGSEAKKKKQTATLDASHSFRLADGSMLEVWQVNVFSSHTPASSIVDLPFDSVIACYPVIFRCVGEKVGTVKQIKKNLGIYLSRSDRTTVDIEEDALTANTPGTPVSPAPPSSPASLSSMSPEYQAGEDYTDDDVSTIPSEAEEAEDIEDDASDAVDGLDDEDDVIDDDEEDEVNDADYDEYAMSE